MRALSSGQSGVSAVEFGLVLPIFLILVLGIIDYGYLYFTHLSMTNAAREGARAGVTRDTDGLTFATTAASNYLAASGVSATVIPTVDSCRVQVAVRIDSFVPLVGFVPVPGSLMASASMRRELADPSCPP